MSTNAPAVTITLAIPLVIAVVGLLMFLLARGASSGAGQDVRELGKIIFAIGFFWFVALVSGIRI